MSDLSRHCYDNATLAQNAISCSRHIPLIPGFPRATTYIAFVRRDTGAEFC